MICPRCHGEGEVHAQRLSVNPFSGVPVPDPQLVEPVPCPRCYGAGVIPARVEAMAA